MDKKIRKQTIKIKEGMNEDYVSFEVAKLLKEKGFDWPCQAFYGNDGALIASPVHTINDELEDSDIACPTLYMAQKWLRSRGYAVEVPYMYGDYWIYDILTIPNHDFVGLADREPTEYMSYEYALQAGILEALKLI